MGVRQGSSGPPSQPSQPGLGLEPQEPGHMPRRHPANKGNQVWSPGPAVDCVVFEPDLEKLRSLVGWPPSGSRRGG